MNSNLSNKCPSCNGTVFFNSMTRVWECSDCKNEFAFEQIQQHNGNAINNQPYNEVLGVVPDSSIDNFLVCVCSSCNSEFFGSYDNEHNTCIFCGNESIKKEKLLNHEVPNYILPFGVTKEEALVGFSKLLKWKLLAPICFNKLKKIDSIVGLYVPFWCYDLEANGEVEFDCTDIKYWKDNRYKYAKSGRFSVRKSGHFDFNKVLVNASLNFDSNVLDSLPYNLEQLVPYNNSYLNGYFVAKCGVDSKTGVERFSNEFKNIAIGLIKNDVNHQNVSVVRDGIRVSAKYTNLVFLPVWMVNVNCRGKKYSFIMNGQTGNVFGNIPFGIIRTIFSFIILSLIIFGILYLIYLVR